MKELVLCACLAVGVIGCSGAEGAEKSEGSESTLVSQAEPRPDRPDYGELYAEVAPGEDDPLSVPVTDGIVWYGTWEDAMAEKERTGRPVMLHFGSPRCPASGVNVPGTW